MRARARESRWRYASGVMPSASAAARLSILNMVPSTNALRPSTSRHCSMPCMHDTFSSRSSRLLSAPPARSGTSRSRPEAMSSPYTSKLTGRWANRPLR